MLRFVHEALDVTIFLWFDQGSSTIAVQHMVGKQ